MNALKCLIVEEQKPAQRVLQQYIARLDHLNLLHVCTNAVEATAHLHNDAIDLIFLDLHLPQMDGLAFLRSVSHCPSVIITTAYSEHAVDAFDLNVADYLLKPFSFERFCRAVSRVSNANREMETKTRPPCLFIKADGDFIRLELDDIVFVSSDGNFLNIITTQARYHIAGTLSDWESRLPDRHFIRTHRSHIVNLNKIIRVGRQHVETDYGRTPMGRTFCDSIIKRISNL